MVKLYSVRVWS